MESLGVASIMEITEFDVSLGQLVTRTLSAEEEADILAIQNAGLKMVSYDIEDTREDKITAVIQQYMDMGYSQAEAASMAEKFVGA